MENIKHKVFVDGIPLTRKHIINPNTGKPISRKEYKKRITDLNPKPKILIKKFRYRKNNQEQQ